MRKLILPILIASALSTPMAGCASDGTNKQASALPSDTLVKEQFAVKTAWPYPKENSGEIEYRAHGRNLTQWITLSYDDTRSSQRPTQVTFNGPLKGDAERGKKIATTTQIGNCVACHTIPGAVQTGTAGPSLAGFAKRGLPEQLVYQIIYDPRVIYGEQTVMPPFGAFNNLNEQEIHDVMAYLNTFQ
ncbi:MAG: sulfur oxidation c-type cytochrome SoxX [Chromatiales bacterium]|nr:sulfur oxidation c-type cytochrome SoxX [Gammaproteobacteria bacterium]MBW6477750.1 sulfur oxidation c-type cytochrome SoxX [Chromatiales bacterium]